MDFELEPLLFKEHKLGKVFVVNDLRTGARFKLRLKHPNYPNTVKKELSVLRFMSKFAGHECFPQVLFADVNNEIMVTDFFAGVSLDKCKDFCEKQREFILEKVTESLHVLHNMTTPVISLVNNQRYDSWYDWLTVIFESYISKINEYGLLASCDEKFIRDFLKQNRSYLQDVKTSVIHADLKPSNIVWNPDTKRVMLIDFESGKIGDPWFDYYRLYSDGWGFKPEHERNPVYLLYRINTFLRWGAYVLAKQNAVEPRAFEGLQKSLELARAL